MANTLLDNLVANWEFDNSYADNGGGGHTMTGVNSPFFGTSPTPVSAYTYSMRVTGGSSQYAYATDHADFDAIGGTNEWSVAFWFRVVTVSGTQYLFDSWSASAGTRSFALYLSGSTLRLRVEVSDTAYDADWGSAISVNTWYCVHAYRSGDTIYVSVDNGTPVSTSLPASASIDSWDQNPTWGARASSPTGHLSGYVNGLSIWSADIGSTNRSEYYNSGSGLAYGSWSASSGGVSIPVLMASYRRRRV